MVTPLPSFIRNWFYGTMLVAGCQVSNAQPPHLFIYPFHLTTLFYFMGYLHLVLWYGQQIDSLYPQFKRWRLGMPSVCSLL
ncbi:hypothetical protein BGW37DRAFT_488786 [Umbelopsis sp. PMI_123]|nr:hypothetical protein BGW37DRAFT_488786 [Umbelopsis sp. PMI_123]